MRLMRVSVFVGVTIDGFLARVDGSFDFLTPFQEDHGFTEFWKSVDALVIGRETYETVLAFPDWPYGKKRLVVLTHRPIDARHGETTHSGELAPLCERLRAEGVGRVYLDGGVTVQQGLDEGIVDDMTITFVPRTIGIGRRLFPGGKPCTNAWTLAGSQQYASGLVQVR
ncbi:MAG TPA: dihydrofolate reductase family protein, partial [Thermoanaerobaculia bacterium]|nr:dihydrofolate reductase family protein [Thermoanaerobaculia bacterium]